VLNALGVERRGEEDEEGEGPQVYAETDPDKAVARAKMRQRKLSLKSIPGSWDTPRVGAILHFGSSGCPFRNFIKL
jgi:hypothetical protein